MEEGGLKMARQLTTRTVAGAILLAILCLDGRLAGETPLTKEPACADSPDIQTQIDCFKLFSECRPMGLTIDVGNDATEIGLTDERVKTIAESRLRAARLYGSSAWATYLYVNVNVVGRAFSSSVGYRKWLKDVEFDLGGVAETWNTSLAGTHGGDAGYILQSVSEQMDRFVAEYLRVNESACGGP